MVAEEARAPRRRWWAFVRPEEWLALAVLLTFWVLDLAGISTFRLRTNFIKAGSDTGAVFLIIATGIAGWRVMRKAQSRSESLPWWMISLCVLFPIAVVGVLAVHVLPFTWNSTAQLVAWAILAAVLSWFAVRTIRATRPSGDVTMTIAALTPARVVRSFVVQIALSMIEFVRTWFPFIVLLAAYENALWLVLEVNPHLYDPQIARLDEILFGGHLDVTFQKITSPALTEVMAFFYDSLYVYPIIIGMALMFQRRPRELRSFLMSFVLAGYVGYVGYMFVPVIGPTYYYPKIYDVDLASGDDLATLEHAPEMAPAEGSTLSFYKLSRQLADKETYGGNTPRNCFPSLHVGWAAVVLIFSWRYLRKLFYVLAIPLFLLIAATSYLRYHYVTDIAGGILLAVLVSDFAPRIVRFWEKMQLRARPGPVPTPDAAEAGIPAIPAGPLTVWSRKPWLAPAIRYGLSVGFFLFVVVFVYSWTPPDRAEAAAAIERRYIRADAPTLPEEARIGATFGKSVELLGIITEPHEWRPGQLVTMTSWWRCDGPVSGRNWKMFVHVRTDNAMVVNADHQPVFDTYPIMRWKKGEYIEDVTVFKVPGDRAAGETLQVWLGFWDQHRDDRRMPVAAPKYPRPVKEDAVKVLERTLQ